MKVSVMFFLIPTINYNDDSKKILNDDEFYHNDVRESIIINQKMSSLSSNLF
jgi:hypothetical protein